MINPTGLCRLIRHCLPASSLIKDLKKEGAQGVLRGLPPRFFGQFRGFFKEFGTKKGGRAPPAPPSGSAPGRFINRLWGEVDLDW